MDKSAKNSASVVDETELPTGSVDLAQMANELLGEVSFKTGALREARNRFSTQLAPDFRIFDFLRTDEMGLSRCLANLLDPVGTHGQGQIYLDAFLNKVGTSASWAMSNKCQVIPEKQANGMRRIDIYLDFQSVGVIGIENKPWAGDQYRQLADYASFMANDAKNGGKKWLLVYLSNHDPSIESMSIKEQVEYEIAGNYIRLTYADLIEWLETCASITKALVVRIFIEELAKFIRTSINGELEMSEENEIKDVILESTANLCSAFKVSNAIGAVRDDLLKKLRIDLESQLKRHAMSLDWNLEGWRPYIGFNIQFDEHPQKLYLRFQFEKSGLDGFVWGIARKDEHYIDADIWTKVNELMRANFASTKTSIHWPWYTKSPEDGFSEVMRDWTTSVEPWKAILDSSPENSLAEKITNIALRVRDIFHGNTLLLREGII